MKAYGLKHVNGTFSGIFSVDIRRVLEWEFNALESWSMIAGPDSLTHYGQEHLGIRGLTLVQVEVTEVETNVV